jgi:hypothetical protein
MTAEAGTAETWLLNAALFALELADAVCLAVEPFFKWLPVFGMLYVLVPYYNQLSGDGDAEDEDDSPKYGHIEEEDYTWR